MYSREEQRAILLEMEKFYPAKTRFPVENADQARELGATLKYLEEHGLCCADVQIGGDGSIQLGASVITARGLDFLADDGGLSAILGIVTIKLRADTIRDTIAAKIEATPIPAEQKATLKRRLAALPQKALEIVATDLVRTGLDHIPDAAHWLSNLLP